MLQRKKVKVENCTLEEINLLGLVKLVHREKKVPSNAIERRVASVFAALGPWQGVGRAGVAKLEMVQKVQPLTPSPCLC